jgi:hypothetical protein
VRRSYIIPSLRATVLSGYRDGTPTTTVLALVATQKAADAYVRFEWRLVQIGCLASIFPGASFSMQRTLRQIVRQMHGDRLVSATRQ